jgi:hypothetical protein
MKAKKKPFPKTPARPPPPRLLLPRFSSVNVPASELDPHLLALRATAISVVLTDILDQKGHLHGGINE